MVRTFVADIFHCSVGVYIVAPDVPRVNAVPDQLFGQKIGQADATVLHFTVNNLLAPFVHEVHDDFLVRATLS